MRASDLSNAQTELDGVLAPSGDPVLSFSAHVGEGSTDNTLTFVLADTSDAVWDTTAYIASLGGTPPEPVDVKLVASDTSQPSNTVFENTTGVVSGVAPGETATFTTEFTGDGQGHGFDLLLVNDATGELLGSIPATLNTDYLYLTRAVDADGDELTFSMPVAPDGATIDPQTGRMHWDPSEAGAYDFVVKVSDGRGGFDLQPYTVNVSVGASNADPGFDSAAPTDAMVNRAYHYDAAASDPDGDRVRYYLSDAPDGMTIDSHSGVVSWTPSPGHENLGPIPVVVQALDGRGGSAVQSFEIDVAAQQIAVNADPRIDSQAPATAVAAHRYEYAVQAVDPDNDPVRFDLAVAPEGMAIDPETGVVVWAPGDRDAGQHRVIVRAYDDHGGSDLEAFDLTVVSANERPQITSDPVDQAGVNLAYQYQLAATDPNGDPLRFAVDPASRDRGVSIDPDTGLLSWTPGAVGDYFIIVAAADGRGGVAYQPFELAVRDNAPPVIDSNPIGPAYLGQQWTYALSGSDPDADGLTFRLVDAPGAMELIDTDADTVEDTLAWTPYAAGWSSVVIEVADGRGGRATQSFELQAVDPGAPNGAPEFASSPTGPAVADREWRYPFHATDPNGDPITFSLGDAPAGMQIMDTDGDGANDTLLWTPTEGGDRPIEVIASDGSASITQSFTLPVLDNAPPTIDSEPTGPVPLDQQYSYQIDASDPNAQDTLSYQLVDPIEGMSITEQDTDSDGVPDTFTFTWTPSETGAYPVEILVSDAQGGTARQSFELQVVDPNATNQAPTITSAPRATIAIGRTYLHQLTADDPEGDALEFSLVSGPSGMTLGTGGLIQWEPTDEQVGGPEDPHSFTVRVDDARGAYTEATFNVAVVHRLSNQPPKIVGEPPLVAAAQAPYVYDADAEDAEQDPLVWQLQDAPDGMEIDAATGRITWTPLADQVGQHKVVLRVLDAYGGADARGFILDTRGANLPPRFISDPPTTASTQQTYQYLVQTVDDNGDPVALSLDQATANLGLTLEGQHGNILTWTNPTLGTHAVAIIAEDGRGDPIEQAYNLEVVSTAINEWPVINSTPDVTAVAGDPYEYAVDAADPEGQTLSYTLDQASIDRGMSVSAAGVISWSSPTVGDYEVEVTVADPDGAGARQRYPLTVAAANQAPQLEAVPDEQLVVGQTYRYTADASDDQPLEFQLGNAPEGMSVDPLGRIVWEVPAGADAPYTGITLTATDPHGAQAQRTFTLGVGPDNQGPQVQLAASLNPAPLDAELTFWVRADDDAGVADLALKVVDAANNEDHLTLAADNSAVYHALAAGSFTVVATPSDASARFR